MGRLMLATVSESYCKKELIMTFCMLAQQIINSELRIQTTKVQMDVEKVSSLKFRINNPLGAMYAPIINPYKEIKS
jgi:hypothetical protein